MFSLKKWELSKIQFKLSLFWFCICNSFVLSCFDVQFESFYLWVFWHFLLMQLISLLNVFFLLLFFSWLISEDFYYDYECMIIMYQTVLEVDDISHFVQSAYKVQGNTNRFDYIIVLRWVQFFFSFFTRMTSKDTLWLHCVIRLHIESISR